MSEITITRANEDEAILVANILNEANQTKLSHGDNAWGVEGWTAEEVAQCMQDSTIYLFKKDDEFVGTVSLQSEDSEVWGTQTDAALYIHRLARTKKSSGLGKIIIDWALQEAIAEGKEFLRLDCPAANSGLCGYYESEGFIRIRSIVDPTHPKHTETTLYERPVPK